MGIYDYDYGYNDYVASGLEAVAGFFAVFFLFVGLIVLAVSIIMYIFNAIGLQTIAKRRGIHHSWLAWVPIGSSWLLGSISDQYQYVAKGNDTKRRTTLLVLNVLGVVLSLLSNASSVGGVLGFADLSAGTVGATLGLYAVAGIVNFGISIALIIVNYIALYDLYNSCNPANATLQLVLSIIFSVTTPFFVFANRKKDLGMPAKKTPAPQIPEPEAPVEEPCVNETSVEEPVEEVPVEAPAKEPFAEEQSGQSLDEVVDVYPEEKPDADSSEQPE